MPYNNTPIPPSTTTSGTVSLPLARVKKIIATDGDIAACSNNAAFVITVATEMFLQHLVEQSYNIVKSERKPRRNVQYRDVANAVARVENLEFLGDVVPRTQTMKSVRQKGTGAAGAVGMGKGQRTLDGGVVGAREDEGGSEGESEAQAVNGAKDVEDKMEVDGGDERHTDKDVSMRTATEEQQQQQPSMPIEKMVEP